MVRHLGSSGARIDNQSLTARGCSYSFSSCEGLSMCNHLEGWISGGIFPRKWFHEGTITIDHQPPHGSEDGNVITVACLLNLLKYFRGSQSPVHKNQLRCLQKNANIQALSPEFGIYSGLGEWRWYVAIPWANKRSSSILRPSFLSVVKMTFQNGRVSFSWTYALN